MEKKNLKIYFNMWLKERYLLILFLYVLKKVLLINIYLSGIDSWNVYVNDRYFRVFMYKIVVKI